VEVVDAAPAPAAGASGLPAGLLVPQHSRDDATRSRLSRAGVRLTLQWCRRLLREGGFGLDYFGFVEGTDISKGTVDVVVTDGFTGNIALKTAEGLAKFIAALMKEALTSSLIAKLGALLAMSALKRMSQKIDPNAINGGPLLGLNGVVVKSHGGATPGGFGAAIRVAVELGRSDYMEQVGVNLQRLTALLARPNVSSADEPVGENTQ
jgi:glycerol-3-phosphate acyltransferase PlsX